MDLTIDITTDRAQPVGEFKFAARSPNSLHGNNPTKLRGEGSQRTRGMKPKKGKDNVSVVPPTSIMEAKIVEERAMEVDGTETGNKKRCRTPLTEPQEENGNGKRVKVEGEVKELGKILKQHLGSVVAAEQPHRTQ